MPTVEPKAKRVEFRCPDPACNPYLAFAAMLMAGLDGIQNRIDPGAAIDKNLYDLPPREQAKIPKTPGTLEEALNALERDHQFLLNGEVFTKDQRAEPAASRPRARLRPLSSSTSPRLDLRRFALRHVLDQGEAATARQGLVITEATVYREPRSIVASSAAAPEPSQAETIALTDCPSPGAERRPPRGDGRVDRLSALRAEAT